MGMGSSFEAQVCIHRSPSGEPPSTLGDDQPPSLTIMSVEGYHVTYPNRSPDGPGSEMDSGNTSWNIP